MDAEKRAELRREIEAWQARLCRDRDRRATRNAAIREHEKALERIAARVSKARAAIRRRRQKLQGGKPAEAVKLALSFVGTTESPPGSNRGPKVSMFQEPFGTPGYPWCGAFVGWVLEKVGVDVSSRIIYTPYIHQDGLAGVNGMARVVRADEVRAGDLVLFHFGSGIIKHVAMATGPVRAGAVPTVEGNTSFSSAGSQDNGGAVAARVRAVGLVHSFVRPAY